MTWMLRIGRWFQSWRGKTIRGSILGPHWFWRPIGWCSSQTTCVAITYFDILATNVVKPLMILMNAWCSNLMMIRIVILMGYEYAGAAATESMKVLDIRLSCWWILNWWRGRWPARLCRFCIVVEVFCVRIIYFLANNLHVDSAINWLKASTYLFKTTCRHVASISLLSTIWKGMSLKSDLVVAIYRKSILILWLTISEGLDKKIHCLYQFYLQVATV